MIELGFWESPGRTNPSHGTLSLNHSCASVVRTMFLGIFRGDIRIVWSFYGAATQGLSASIYSGRRFISVASCRGRGCCCCCCCGLRQNSSYSVYGGLAQGHCDLFNHSCQASSENLVFRTPAPVNPADTSTPVATWVDSPQEWRRRTRPRTAKHHILFRVTGRAALTRRHCSIDNDPSPPWSFRLPEDI